MSNFATMPPTVTIGGGVLNGDRLIAGGFLGMMFLVKIILS
jgi:hypothetical protein